MPASIDYHALSMLYLNAQDLSGKTPSEILEMYLKAYKEMEEANKARNKERRQGRTASNTTE